MKYVLSEYPLLTTLDIKSSSNISNPFDKNIVSPQGDGLRGYLFIIYLEKALRTLRAIGEHSYADSFKNTLPEKCINADDTDLINNSAEKRKRQLRLVTLTFADLSLQINDTKTQHTVLKRGEKKNEEKRTTKKLCSLIGDQEDILHRKQPSTPALNNLRNIWIKKNRIREHV